MAEALRPLELDLIAGDVEDWYVERLDGNERLNELYGLDLELVYTGAEHDLEEQLLGQPAQLHLRSGDSRRVFYGLVSSVTARGRIDGDDRHARYRMRIVPRAWLMSLRRQSRVFQDMSVDQVVSEVLSPYHIPSRFVLASKYPARDYCTQYEETDLEFVQRITAEEGIFFYFEHPFAELEDLLGDASSALRSIAGALPAALGRLAGQFTAPREVMVFADRELWYPPMARSEQEALAHLQAMGEQLASEGLRRVGGPATQIAEAALGFSGSASPTLEMRSDSGALQQSRDDTVLSFERTTTMKPVAAVIRHFEPSRPHTPLSADKRQGDAEDAISRGLEAARDVVGELSGGNLQGAAQAATPNLEGSVEQLGELGAAQLQDLLWRERLMEHYEHHTRHLFPEHDNEDWEHAKEDPERILEAARRRADVSTGRSICPWLTPGHRFTLHGHALEHLDREWVPVEVHHRVTGEQDAESRTYENHFECVPSDVSYRPDRPQRRFVQATLTGIVVGGEEIHTDEHGRVRVRFHWDRGAQADGYSTCWLRVMQPWAGTGWGAQFIPRVGHEVVISFEDGDPDKPLVVGSVYNGVNRHPFELPEHRTVSGLRTSSTPGGGGHNELSFDDATDHEKVHLRAQKDLDIHVLHDRSATIDRRDRTVVKEDQELRVEGDRRLEMRQLDDRHVHGDDQLRVEGTKRTTVVGQAEARYEGGRQTLVEGQDSAEVRGSSDLHARGDVTQRVGGNYTLLVGSSEGKRNHNVHVEGDAFLTCSDTIQISADSTVVIRCGESSIVMSPKRILLDSPEVMVVGKDAHTRLKDGEVRIKGKTKVQAVSDKVLLKSSGAAMGLTSEARVDGSQILLNSPEQASDSVDSSDEEPTVIELVDQNGNAIAHHPYKIILGDGTELSGRLDDNGRAELQLEESGTVTFPGLNDVDPE